MPLPWSWVASHADGSQVCEDADACWAEQVDPDALVEVAYLPNRDDLRVVGAKADPVAGERLGMVRRVTQTLDPATGEQRTERLHCLRWTGPRGDTVWLLLDEQGNALLTSNREAV